ncbi:MAG: trigger factor [Lentisphaerae bacterium]|nr:trigger factor [Lentisphaerota bacterium]MCP4101491.1 trigger factor [Lentisphaerota bacterium]
MAKNDLSSALLMDTEEVAPCQKKFDFTAEKDTIEQEVKKVIREISGMVVIPGFRKGKAPKQMVMKRYGKDVIDEMKRRIYSAAFEKVTADESMDIVSYGVPSEEAEMKIDDAYKFSLKFDLAPEFEVGEYKGVKVKVDAVTVDPKAVEERVDYYRNMYATYADIDTPAEKEDMLKVSYTSDFELPEDASPALKRQVEAENNWLWLSDPEMIPGAIKAMTGAEGGKEYTFTANYPKDWRDAELAGKKVKYTVNVLNVQRRKPLSDEELAEKMQIESLEKLTETLSQSMIQETEMKRRGEIADDVYQAVSKNINDFELPPGVLEGEIEKELRRVAQSSVKSEEDAETFKKDIEKHRKEAEKSAADKLRRMFIMRKIAKAENISVEQHEIDGQIKNMSKYYGYKEKEFRSMLEKSGGMEDMHLDILAAKVSDFLVDNAEVTENAAKKAPAKKPAVKKTAAKKAE